MEKEVKIRTPNKHIIYGTLRLAKKKSSVLLIFVHGLGGHQNEHIFYNGARYFSEKGINTFRFDLYTSEKGGRVLTKCGISTHAKDLDTIIKHFRNKFKKIFVAGHSLGGLTILCSRTRLPDGVILWDSAHSRKWREKSSKKFGKYIIRWGVEFLIGEKMLNERENLPPEKDLTSKVNKPIKIIVAGNGILIKTSQTYYKHANKPKEFAIVKGAGHNFNEDGTAEKLFTETYGFIKRFT